MEKNKNDIRKQVAWGILAMVMFFIAFAVCEEHQFMALVLFIASGYSVQKAGIVNFKEELTKPY